MALTETADSGLTPGSTSRGGDDIIVIDDPAPTAPGQWDRMVAQPPFIGLTAERLR